MSHSPEPWSAHYEITGENAWDPVGSAYWEIRDASGAVLAEIDRDRDDLAQRIVACVNACRGIPTEVLQSLSIVAHMESLRHGLSVAVGDLLAQGMPKQGPTGKLLIGYLNAHYALQAKGLPDA